jgi:hypothetical protein
MMKVPEAIQDVCKSFVEGLTTALGKKLVGVYLYGAWAFPEAGSAGDIDFHVILSSELTDQERSQLERLHEALAEQFPPLGGEMDGYYLLLSDALRESPPQSQMWQRAVDDAWALHCEHIRAGRCIVLYGTDPMQIYPPTSWSEIEHALLGELDYVERHLTQYPAYCILNLCRLMYSFETRDVVVSKIGSARWAVDKFPEWREVIEAARKSYAGNASPQEVELLQRKLSEFFNFACEYIRRS